MDEGRRRRDEAGAGIYLHRLNHINERTQVLFICTANLVDTIPGPLQDRMEIIRLSGYATHTFLVVAFVYVE